MSEINIFGVSRWREPRIVFFLFRKECVFAQSLKSPSSSKEIHNSRNNLSDLSKLSSWGIFVVTRNPKIKKCLVVKRCAFFWDTTLQVISYTYFENEIQSLYIGVFVTQLYWPTSFTPLKNRHAWWWWIIECYWVDCSPKCNFCHLKNMWEIHLYIYAFCMTWQNKGWKWK